LLFIFAYLNFKNKVYLGDGGVYFLGFLASYFLIKTYNFENIIYVEEIIIILLIPIVDMVRLFFTRIYLGRNPFLPDTNHIHHIINKKYGNKVIFFISFLLIIPQVLLFFEINYYLVLFIQMTLYIFFMTKLNSVKKKLR
jgi:UDP-GlcNAc:undecaprenyl-phosphate GlcNAc-1-phosphate transferase